MSVTCQLTTDIHTHSAVDRGTESAGGQRGPLRRVAIIVVGDGPAADATVRSLARTRSVAKAATARVVPQWYIDLLPDGEDVVLIAAGTLLRGDWLDRLAAHAHADPSTGSVSPLCNLGPSCAKSCQGDAASLEWAEIDRLASVVNAGRRARALSIGNCCTYLRADRVAAIRGAGVSALQLGHTIAADVYVHHLAGYANTSFGVVSADRSLGLANGHALSGAEDAAFVFRRRLDVARLATGRSSILLITHPGGGGTERHVRDMAAALERDGVSALVLRPFDNQVLLESVTRAESPKVLFRPGTEHYTLTFALRSLSVFHIHVHHLLGFHPAFNVGQLIESLGLPFDYTFHDYYLACPRVHLAAPDGRYCGEPHEGGCNACIAQHGDIDGRPVPEGISNWRQAGGQLLRAARKVFVPNADVGRRIARYFPDVKPLLRPHAERLALDPVRPAPYRAGERLRVATLGILARHKGAIEFLECARDAFRRNLPLDFVLVGNATDVQPIAMRAAGVIITGEYREDDVFDLLRKERCHCTLFLSTLPETYCYTLSIAQSAGLYQIGFDLGAIGDRIPSAGWGELIPRDTSPAKINDRLMELRDLLAKTAPPSAPAFARYPSILRDYYDLEAPKAVASMPGTALATTAAAQPSFAEQ